MKSSLSYVGQAYKDGVFTELWSGKELCLTLVIADVSHAVLTRDVVPVSASRERYRLC